VEVLVSLVILEVGLLAALSVGTIATRTMIRATRLELAVAAGTALADSLSVTPGVTDGTAVRNEVGARWSRATEGWLIRVEIGPGDSIELLGALTPAPR
jgi:hypothetical protein